MKLEFITLFTIAVVVIVELSLPLRASEWSKSEPRMPSPLPSQTRVERFTADSISGGPGFSISMPESPTLQPQITNLGGQNLSWQVFRAEPGEELYVLAYTDLSSGEVRAGGSAIVASIAENLLSETNLDALRASDREVFLGIHPGREFLGIINDHIVAARLYLIGDRLYALFTRTEEMQAVDQFFRSFRTRPVWETLTSPQGNFTVRTPVVATTETYTSKVEDETLNWTAFRADGSAYSNLLETPGTLENLYVVAYTDLPTHWLQQDATGLLDDFSSRLIHRLSLEEELGGGSRPITLAGHPGQERLGLEAEQVVVTRLYLVGQRLYVLFTMAKTMADVNQFLESFQLL